MLKRVLAWIILAGFVLLLLNIVIFHFYLQACIAVYLVIVIFFVLSSGKIIPTGAETGNNRFAGRDGGTDTDTGADAMNTAEDAADRSEDGQETGEYTGEGEK